MRKILKMIGIILLIVILLIAAGLGFLYYVVYYAPMVPKEYWSEVETGGTIEANYLACFYRSYPTQCARTGQERQILHFYSFFIIHHT